MSEVKRVRITKGNRSKWYHNKIGEVYMVHHYDMTWWRFLDYNGYHFIDKSDCEIVEDEMSKKVRITKCHSSRWYSSRVGEIFEVEEKPVTTNSGAARWWVKKGLRSLIHIADCVIVERPTEQKWWISDEDKKDLTNLVSIINSLGDRYSLTLVRNDIEKIIRKFQKLKE